MSELMSLPEVAAYLRRAEGTLRQWRHRGFGPRGFRVGGSVMYRRAEVEQWLVEQQRMGGAA